MIVPEDDWTGEGQLEQGLVNQRLQVKQSSQIGDSVTVASMAGD